MTTINYHPRRIGEPPSLLVAPLATPEAFVINKERWLSFKIDECDPDLYAIPSVEEHLRKSFAHRKGVIKNA